MSSQKHSHKPVEALVPSNERPSVGQGADHAATLSDLVLPPLRERPPAIKTKQKKLTPAGAVEEITRQLPPEFELHRTYHYQVPLSKNARLDVIILKVNAPRDLEHKLREWERDVDDRFDMVTVIVDRVDIAQNIKNHLEHEFKECALLTSDSLPKINEMINVVGGAEMSPSSIARFSVPKRKRLISKAFIAIDPKGALDMEDLVHAERRRDGTLVWRAAFINVTDHVQPGSLLDKQARRRGTTLYGRSRTISTLGPELSSGKAAFQEGEYRPAWVVEVAMRPHIVRTKSGELRSEYRVHGDAKIFSALVRNKRCFDSMQPLEPTGDEEIDRCLSALTEVARRLEDERLSRPSLFRVEGYSPASKIVEEIMVKSKSLLAEFVGKHKPVIYRVHEKPSKKIMRRFATQLNDLGIPAVAKDFENPGQLAGIMRSLRDNRSANSSTLLRELLDALLLRSQYSTKKLGHYALRLDSYLEVKPRDATGIANQYQLAAILEGGKALSRREMRERANQMNQNRRNRDWKVSKLRTLEVLQEKLPSVGQLCFGSVAHIGENGTYVEIEHFSHWGILLQAEPKESLRVGAPVATVLKGFDREQMRFVFELEG